MRYTTVLQNKIATGAVQKAEMTIRIIQKQSL